MIIDHRTYAIKPGKLNDYLDVYQTEGWPLQLKYLGHCVGWYVSDDIGPLSQVVHLWAFRSLADREERRDRMAADPAWPVFVEREAPLVYSMENKILRQATWFKIPELKA